MGILLLMVFSAVSTARLDAATCGTSEMDSTSWECLTRLANQRHDADDLAGEEKLRREALRLAQEKLSSDDPNLAPMFSNLAITLDSEGRDAEADPLARRAVILAEQGGNQRVLGLMLNALGVVLMGEQQLPRAEPVLRRSVALLEAAVGADAFEVARAANNLATLYSDTRQFGKAEKELARALPVYEKALGTEHPLYAMVLGNMFAVLYEQHRLAEGEPYLRRALAIAESAFPHSINMARLQHCLAALETTRGNYKEAARLLEQVIATEEKVLGPQHPELARSLASYSGVLQHLHQKTEAKMMQNRADLIQKSLLSDVK